MSPQICLSHFKAAIEFDVKFISSQFLETFKQEYGYTHIANTS